MAVTAAPPLFTEVALDPKLNIAANIGVLLAYEVGTVTYFNLRKGVVVEDTVNNISMRNVSLELIFGLNPCYMEELEVWFDNANPTNVSIHGRQVLDELCTPQLYTSNLSPAKSEDMRFSGFATYN